MRVVSLPLKGRMGMWVVRDSLFKRGQCLKQLHQQQITNLPPFSSASGKAVCCAVIFQGNLTEIPATWRTGVDVRVTPIMTENGEEIDVEMNLGKGKYYPGWPTCT